MCKYESNIKLGTNSIYVKIANYPQDPRYRFWKPGVYEVLFCGSVLYSIGGLIGM